MADRTRPQLKLARTQAQPIEVPRLDGETDYHYTARCASIEALGVNWSMHPEYPRPARHSLNPEVSGPARAPYLSAISRAAATDRARNPLTKMQQRINAAMEDTNALR